MGRSRITPKPDINKACRKVASDLTLGGGLSWALRAPPPTTG